MTHCVPSWDLEDNSSNPGRLKAAFSNSMSSNLDVPTLDYEVAELTWKNGQLAMHGLGPPRLGFKSHATGTAALTKYTWDKPHTAETLEAIVDQATLQLHHKPSMDHYTDELVPWLDYNSSTVASGSVSASVTTTMDALVPSSATQPHALLSGIRAPCSTRVGSCSIERSGFVGGGLAVAAAAHEWSSYLDQSVSGSDTFGLESSRQLTVETQSPELGSPDDIISGKRSTKSTSPDEHDSVCHSRSQKNEMEEKKKGKVKSSSIGTKRSRAAAVHNQSERKRRDKINEKMKTLQKLVPNANKTDKASMLDEVIEYLKQLQAQVNMIGRMNMSPMMMPFSMQQQLQMAMMNPMGMGIGMGMTMPGVMDLNAIGGSHPNIPGMPPVFHPSTTFMQPSMAPWEMHNTRNRVPVPNHNDPMATFLASQSQPMTMEGYSRMAALFQQMQNQPCYSSAGLKN